MTIVNIHDAKTQFSRLVDAASRGETITIAKAGRPVAKLTRLEAQTPPTRLGFLRGRGRIPEDFDRLGSGEIESLFTGTD